MKPTIALLLLIPLLIACSLPAAKAPAPALAPPALLEPLRAELTKLVSAWPGEHAVSVLDLQTNERISINGNRPQLAACTIKIAIMAAVAEDIAAGRYTADAVAPLVQAAMGPSATAPARTLIERVGNGSIRSGIQRINALMTRAGMQHSLLTHPPGYFGEEHGYDASHGLSDNFLTTDDLATLLAALYNDTLLTPGASEYALWSMTIAPDWMDQPFRNTLPPDARTYHKIGQLYAPLNAWNDAGIVVVRRNDRDYAYAVAYLGNRGSDWQASYAHEMAISAAVWRHVQSTTVPAPVSARQRLSGLAVISASSTLADEDVPGVGAVDFAPQNAADHNPSTVWVEGVTGDGVGERLRFTFKRPVQIDSVGVNVGFDRDGAIYAANNRLRQARVVFADGSEQSVTFKDVPGMQVFKLQPVSTTTAQLIIEDVYPGTRYRDTALASIEFWGTP